MPAVKPGVTEGCYDIYPVFRIGDGKIHRGTGTLAEMIRKERIVLIDGYVGVFFEMIREELDTILKQDFDVNAEWINTGSFMLDEDSINEKISPFLGGDDALFGTRTNLFLSDFFDILKIKKFRMPLHEGPVIIYGTGAALFPQEGLLVYLDLPKNELQYRSRAGKVVNLGASEPDDPVRMYKRFYFVDWVVLNRHKKNIIQRIDVLADVQRPGDITWTRGDDFRNSLGRMTVEAVRARPWFEPGAWGGSWIKNKIRGVNRNVPNYAWSFELITPENGLILESSGLMTEFSFDFLMYHDAESVLGDCYDRFGTDFPIRLDFLDTYEGGNLSIQCHPRPGYMKENFGEGFTQEESYYILDSGEESGVFLGFREDVEPYRFKSLLEESHRVGKTLNIEELVQLFPSKIHDLFLIPYGTVHGAAKNNLVLEISTTPYIFTFKMYDWLRPDLNGKPRTLNIERGMENLFFERKGKAVREELISSPVLREEGPDWQLFHLPTHPTHIYDVYRYVFKTVIDIVTNNKCHVLNLTGGISIKVKTKHGTGVAFNYAETFIIPAASVSYRVFNQSEEPAILILAFVK